MRHIFSLFLTLTLSFSSSLYSAEMAQDFIQQKKAIKNELYFKSDGSKFYVYFPYNYLEDEHPAKMDALKYVDKVHLSILKQWVSFYLESTGIDAVALKKLVDDQSTESYKALSEFIKENPIDRVAPSELFDRAQKNLEKANKDVTKAIPKGKSNSVDQILQELANSNLEKKKLQLYVADFRKEFEEAYSDWLVKDKNGYISDAIDQLFQKYPDYRVAQLSLSVGSGLENWLKSAAETSSLPAVRSLLTFLSNFKLSALRLTLTTRPWILRTYDLNSEEMTEEVITEGMVHLWINKQSPFNIGLGDQKVKSQKFFRIAFGGINGIYDNIKDIEGLSFSASFDTNLGFLAKRNSALNVKFGLITPLKLSLSDLMSDTNPLASFQMLGIQAGSAPSVPFHLKTEGSYIISMPNLSNRLNLDYSGLHELILKGLQDRSPVTGYPGVQPWPPSNGGPRVITNPGNGTNPSIPGIFPGNSGNPTIPIIPFQNSSNPNWGGRPRTLLLEGLKQSYDYTSVNSEEDATKEDVQNKEDSEENSDTSINP